MADTVDISDHSKSVAFQCLTEHENNGQISSEQRALFESKYSKLFDVVLSIYEKETVLKKKAQVLAQEKDGLEHDIKHNDDVKQENETKINDLQEDVQKLTLELGETKEYQIAVDIEKKDLEAQLENIGKVIEQTKKAATEQFLPAINQVKTELRELEASLEKQKLIMTKQVTETAKVQQEMTDLIEKREKLSEDLVKRKTTFNKMKSEPDRLRHNAEQYEQAVQSLERELKNARYKLQAKQTELNKLKQTENAKIDELKQRDKEIDHMIAKTEEKKLSLHLIKQEVTETKNDIVTEQLNKVPLDESLAQEQEELKIIQDEFALIQRQRNVESQRLQQSEAERTKHETNISAINHEIQNVHSITKKLMEERDELQKRIYKLEDEIALKLSELTEDDQFKLLVSEIEEIDGEYRQDCDNLNDLKRTLLEKQGNRNSLRQERNMIIRKVAQKKDEAMGMEEGVKLLDIDLLFMKKRAESIQKKIVEIGKQAEIVKLERNKYLGAIQEAVQVLAEYREKIKILENEKETLRNEDFIKQKSLIDTRLNVQSQVNTRNTELRKLNDYAQKDREIKATIDQQIGEMDKLNSHVNSVETEMLRLKKEYEYQVEQRNYTGIQLVQRNDELCIHYEKLNVQDGVLKRGTVALNQKQDELKMLMQEAQEMVREVNLQEKQLPQIEIHLRKLAEEQQKLAELRRKTNQLAIDLESPSNKARWRKLAGDLPSREDLEDKLASLQDRYNIKKESILEKDIVMEEISGGSNQLRERAAQIHSESALEMSKSVNETRQRLRKVDRALQSVLGELTVIKIESENAEGERNELEQFVQQCRVNLEEGLPPSQEVEQRWYTLLRRREEQRERKAQRELDLPVGEVQTTAPPRFNAYIPDDGLGLPVPYSGQFQQFRPSEQGSSMRHIKNAPKKKAIKL